MLTAFFAMSTPLIVFAVAAIAAAPLSPCGARGLAFPRALTLAWLASNVSTLIAVSPWVLPIALAVVLAAIPVFWIPPLHIQTARSWYLPSTVHQDSYTSICLDLLLFYARVAACPPLASSSFPKRLAAPGTAARGCGRPSSARPLGVPGRPPREP